LPYFIYTFEEFGRRGIGKDRIPFQLIRVQSVKDGSSAPSKVIYSSATGKMADPAPVIDLGDLEAEGKYLSIGPGPVDVTIRFQTPVNVVTLGHIDHVLSFSSFMKSLVRRIKLLQHFHCLDDARAPQMSPCGISSPEPPKPRSSSASKASSMGQNPDTPRSGADPAGKDEPQGLITQKLESHLLSLADQATTADRQLKWIGQSRKSGHSGDPMTLSGFVGEMKYRFTNIEPLAELFPYLCVGEYIHIGKHTGFGLGKYSVQTTGTPELPERQT
jgi:hypothetical protein